MFTKPQSTRISYRFLISFFAVIFLIMIAGALIISSIVFQPMFVASPRHIVLASDSSIQDSANHLYTEGVIKNPFLFRMFLAIRYPDKTIKAGEYDVVGAVSMTDIASLFIQGAPRKELTMRIIEGWSIKDIAAYLESAFGISAKTFSAATLKDYSDSFPFLPPRGQSITVEGYLFPDTYRIFADSTPEEIITKMLENFRLHYSEDMIRQTKEQKRTIQEVVIMASIIEREVQTKEDKARVADIFYRRLAAGMPLQADSTVNYITGKGDARARADDLAIDSPYNTYRRKGLPPGAISNPGLASLAASLYPEKNPYWYFLTTPDSTVIYSKTFEEHVANKQKYLIRKVP